MAAKGKKRRGQSEVLGDSLASLVKKAQTKSRLRVARLGGETEKLYGHTKVFIGSFAVPIARAEAIRGVGRPRLEARRKSLTATGRLFGDPIAPLITNGEAIFWPWRALARRLF
jgi:hypothetical protein